MDNQTIFGKRHHSSLIFPGPHISAWEIISYPNSCFPDKTPAIWLRIWRDSSLFGLPLTAKAVVIWEISITL